MSVSSYALGPLTYFSISLFSSLRRGPESHVVVKEVGEVILNQVLPRNTQVEGVPVSELTPQMPRLNKVKGCHDHDWCLILLLHYTYSSDSRGMSEFGRSPPKKMKSQTSLVICSGLRYVRKRYM